MENLVNKPEDRTKFNSSSHEYVSLGKKMVECQFLVSIGNVTVEKESTKVCDLTVS